MSNVYCQILTALVIMFCYCVISHESAQVTCSHIFAY